MGLSIICFLWPHPHSSFAKGGATLKVISYNLGPLWKKEVLVSLIRDQEADIIFLQEVGSIKKLKEVAEVLKYDFLPKPSGSKHSDVAILSKFPLKLKKEFTLIGWPKGRQTAICALANIKNKAVLLSSLHLKNIFLNKSKSAELTASKAKLLGIGLRETFLDNYRSKGIIQFLSKIKNLRYDCAIIGGDFNSLPFSKAIRKMRSVFNDCSWMNKTMFQSTVKYKCCFLPIKVDYIFCSKGLEYSDTQIIKISQGDHYPIITNIAF